MDYITQIENDFKQEPKEMTVFFDKKNNRLIVGLVLLINKMSIDEFLKYINVVAWGDSLTIFEKDEYFKQRGIEEVLFEIKYTIDLKTNSIVKNEDDNIIKIKDFNNYDFIKDVLFFYFLENNMEKKYLLFINELSIFEEINIDKMKELSGKYNLILHKLFKNSINNKQTKDSKFLLDDKYLLEVKTTGNNFYFWIITSTMLKNHLFKVVDL